MFGCSTVVFEHSKGNGLEQKEGCAECAVPLREDESDVKESCWRTSEEGGLNMEAGL